MFVVVIFPFDFILISIILTLLFAMCNVAIKMDSTLMRALIVCALVALCIITIWYIHFNFGILKNPAGSRQSRESEQSCFYDKILDDLYSSMDDYDHKLSSFDDPEFVDRVKLALSRIKYIENPQNKKKHQKILSKHEKRIYKPHNSQRKSDCGASCADENHQEWDSPMNKVHKKVYRASIKTYNEPNYKVSSEEHEWFKNLQKTNDYNLPHQERYLPRSKNVYRVFSSTTNKPKLKQNLEDKANLEEQGWSYYFKEGDEYVQVHPGENPPAENIESKDGSRKYKRVYKASLRNEKRALKGQSTEGTEKKTTEEPHKGSTSQTANANFSCSNFNASQDTNMTSKINNFIDKLLESGGNKTEQLGLCKNLKDMYDPEHYINYTKRHEVLQHMVVCVEKLLNDTSTKTSQCGPLPSDLFEFMEWLFTEGTCLHDACKKQHDSKNVISAMFLFAKRNDSNMIEPFFFQSQNISTVKSNIYNRVL